MGVLYLKGTPYQVTNDGNDGKAKGMPKEGGLERKVVRQALDGVVVRADKATETLFVAEAHLLGIIVVEYLLYVVDILCLLA